MSGASVAETSPLSKLRELGQSPWLDHIERDLLDSGELRALIERVALGGLTSNPTIFAAAFRTSGRYDDDVARLARAGATAAEIYEALVVADITAAAMLFAPTYTATDGRDGFVSLEVSPHLADDRDATIAEAERLWRAISCPNAMIKVPATTAGVEAAEALLGRGVNVNVTLLFSLERYREVAEAYLAGLERAAADGLDLARIASVASFFLSRIDTALDARLELLVAEHGTEQRAAKSLRGQVAIANAKRAYAMYERQRAGKRFAKLEAKGARPQRLLWASTSTKSSEQSDVKYVEALIGPETVNTMPLATLRAYDDHGMPAPRLREGASEAAEDLKRLSAIGIDLSDVTERLLAEGIAAFRESYDAALAAIEEKRAAVV